jgi:hypothetical protein
MQPLTLWAMPAIGPLVRGASMIDPERTRAEHCSMFVKAGWPIGRQGFTFFAFGQSNRRILSGTER